MINYKDVQCPVCGRWFSMFRPDFHIGKYHKNATERELMLIRDARRAMKDFHAETGKKSKNATLKNINKSDGTTLHGGLPSLGKKR
ncbi:hypothetical protein ACQ3G7_15095 [Kosakonia oryzendophytica]|uniref:hypothetical protein n=1 Tax=Kosakonia oryzendophytica TaxID=1005665 RepID=UPI003D33413C